MDNAKGVGPKGGGQGARRNGRVLTAAYIVFEKMATHCRAGAALSEIKTFFCRIDPGRPASLQCALFFLGKAGEMPKLIFVLSDGKRREVEVENGYSVMEAAINNNIEGIVAECGGACACATCHSYVDEEWLAKMPEMDDMEDSMLDAAYDRKDNSRLTCQLEMNDDWDGLVIHVAENEY